MSADELRRALDYQEGDIIQIKPDGKEYAGRLGMIIGIQFCAGIRPESEDSLSYRVKLSDSDGVALAANRMRLVRAAGSNKTLSEQESKYKPRVKGKIAWEDVGRD